MVDVVDKNGEINGIFLEPILLGDDFDNCHGSEAGVVNSLFKMRKRGVDH